MVDGLFFFKLRKVSSTTNEPQHLVKYVSNQDFFFNISNRQFWLREKEISF